ncbi:MAG: hypothetical protein J7L14_02035 [Candidatus Diapherotrites archaeon]|nr:hypothetical protein [Candidatus Diapherotrites archaeon]
MEVFGEDHLLEIVDSIAHEANPEERVEILMLGKGYAVIGRRFGVLERDISDEEFIKRINIMRQIAREAESKGLADYIISNVPGKPAVLSFVLDFVLHCNKNFYEAVKDLRRNIRIAKAICGKEHIIPNAKDFSYRIMLRMHPEAPFALILYHEGIAIGTIGGYFEFGREKRFIITNIQGIKGRKKELEEFSRAVGRKWRVWLVERIAEILKRKGYGVIGNPPASYLEHVAEQAELDRARRMYANTYKRAGFKRSGRRWRA